MTRDRIQTGVDPGDLSFCTPFAGQRGGATPFTLEENLRTKSCGRPTGLRPRKAVAWDCRVSSLGYAVIGCLATSIHSCYQEGKRNPPMSEHDITKALEIWTLQTLLTFPLSAESSRRAWP